MTPEDVRILKSVAEPKAPSLEGRMPEPIV